MTILYIFGIAVLVFLTSCVLAVVEEMLKNP